MAAIAGMMTFNDTHRLPPVRQIMARMACRAPDGVAVFEDSVVSLAHGALHATPESIYERQPVRLGDRYVVVVDGRIDNRRELCNSLGIKEADAKDIGDADLFAQAWWKWGEDFWQHLTGDYAIAVWDTDRRRLILMRDRMGARPLFYMATPDFLAFASDPEALLGLAKEGGDALDRDRLVAHITSHYLDDDLEATWYRGVRRLLPAHAIHASPSGAQNATRYWSIEPKIQARLADRRDYVEAFREIFMRAVNCRLRAPSKPGLMLSGGIDSASVLAASRLLGDDLLLPVTVVAEVGQRSGERENIERMLGDAPALKLLLQSSGGLSDLTALVSATWDLAHPVDNSAILARLACLAARGSGCNVMLDGVDGDLVMQSPPQYVADLLLAGAPMQAMREARRASRVHTHLRGMHPVKILGRGLAMRLAPTWVAGLVDRVGDANPLLRDEDALVNREAATRLGLSSRLLAEKSAMRRTRTGQSAQQRIAHSWEKRGLGTAMEGFDRIAGGFGMESRHPWCDLRVVEFFLNLPVDLKVHDGWTKWIARTAFAADLGEDVAWHSGKQHFGPHVTHAILEASVERVDSLLDDAPEALSGIVDARAVAALRGRWHEKRAASSHPSFDESEVLKTATLVAWMRRVEMAAKQP